MKLMKQTQSTFSSVTIIIPVFNEKETIQQIIQKVKQAKTFHLEKEIIIVNDCSSDGTDKVLDGVIDSNINIFHHSKNQGKGAALRTGFSKATGDIVIIQDADMEYDPNEYEILLEPIIYGKADVVFGSRFISSRPHRVLYFWHYLGNKLLTFTSNMFSNLNLTDMETCYKVFKRHILLSIQLKENRFGFEPEITAKIAKIKNIHIYEVGISYHGRSYDEGKKIGWKDGVKAMYCIFKYNLFK